MRGVNSNYNDLIYSCYLTLFSKKCIIISMIGLGLSGLIGAGIGLLGTGIQSGINWSVANNNLSLQRETNALNEQLTREAWARDDSAIQRRVADLRAAGINPLNAITGASTTSPISMSAPKNDYKQSNPFESAIANLMMSQQFAVQDADIRQSNAQASYYDALANRVSGQTDNDIISYVNQGMAYLQNMDDVLTAGRQNPSMIARTFQSIPFLSDLASAFNSEYNMDQARVARNRIAGQRSKLFDLYFKNLDAKLGNVNPDKPVFVGTEIRSERKPSVLPPSPVIYQNGVSRETGNRYERMLWRESHKFGY